MRKEKYIEIFILLNEEERKKSIKNAPDEILDLLRERDDSSSFFRGLKEALGF